MTALDRRLAETFARARWPQTQGAPVCPKHFDAEGVRERTGERRMKRPELPVYWCALCLTRFTAATQTVLAGSAHPLRAWALALLAPVDLPRAMTRCADQSTRMLPVKPGVSPAALRRMRAQWAQGTQLGPRWLAELQAAGITVAQLIGAKP